MLIIYLFIIFFFTETSSHSIIQQSTIPENTLPDSSSNDPSPSPPSCCLGVSPRPSPSPTTTASQPSHLHHHHLYRHHPQRSCKLHELTIPRAPQAHHVGCTYPGGHGACICHMKSQLNRGSPTTGEQSQRERQQRSTEQKSSAGVSETSFYIIARLITFMYVPDLTYLPLKSFLFARWLCLSVLFWNTLLYTNCVRSIL